MLKHSLIFQYQFHYTSMQKGHSYSITDNYIIQKNKVLGSGSSGTVYRGIQISSRSPVAIKVVDLQTIDNEVSLYLLKMEKKALLSLNHSNLLKGLEIYQQNNTLYLITQYCNGGTFKQLIAKQSKKIIILGGLSETTTLQILKGLIKGLIQCQRKEIIHRDIKPDNIMLHNGIPKLIDFGFCYIKGYTKPKVQYNVGSPSYMAPQTYKFNMHNQKTEVWALGITMFQSITGHTIDKGRDMNDCFRQIIEFGIKYPQSVSLRFQKLINWCLQIDPKRRPSLINLLAAIQPMSCQEINGINSTKKRKSFHSYLNLPCSTLYHKQAIQKICKPILNVHKQVLQKENSQQNLQLPPLNNYSDYQPTFKYTYKNTKNQTCRNKYYSTTACQKIIKNNKYNDKYANLTLQQHKFIKSNQNINFCKTPQHKSQNKLGQNPLISFR